jgi:hypothetical protein
MAKKTKSAGSTPEEPASLLTDREDADRRILEQAEKGRALVAREIRSEAELDSARRDFERWNTFNKELLSRIFSNHSVAERYSRFYGSSISMRPTLGELVASLRDDVLDKINRLEGIRETLELIPTTGMVKMTATSKSTGSSVFVVHGHDEAAREQVARFVEKLRLSAVILHEQTNQGRTIIEKFESHADVGFAIVLLTPDDVGATKKDAANLKPRARQNVILELGYFVGKLGRANCISRVSSCLLTLTASCTPASTMRARGASRWPGNSGQQASPLISMTRCSRWQRRETRRNQPRDRKYCLSRPR